MAPSVVTAGGAGGVELAVHHLGGDGPPVMLVHATGFHGRCWIPLARSLFPYFTVWALDQRGHGASGKDPDGRYDDWDAFASDLLAAVDAIGGTGWRAAGHSLGGGVSLLAEARRPGTFAAIACYEPVVIPPGAFETAPVPPGSFDTRSGRPGSFDTAPVRPGSFDTRPGPSDRRNPLAVLARKRRPSFPSRQAALENYRSKPPFSAFTAEALECYVEYGFVDQPDGTVTLACRREDEAAVFEGALHSPTWSVLADVRPPVAVLAGSDQSDPVGRIAADVARRLPRGGFRRVAGLDHFGPMTDPELVGSLMGVALQPGERVGDGEESPMPVTPPK